MKSRHTLFAAVAAFAFSASVVAAIPPPLNPCKQCRTHHKQCMSNGGFDGSRDCETPFSQCLISAGCPLE
jgi:hypothetical protein